MHVVSPHGLHIFTAQTVLLNKNDGSPFAWPVQLGQVTWCKQHLRMILLGRQLGWLLSCTLADLWLKKVSLLPAEDDVANSYLLHCARQSPYREGERAAERQTNRQRERRGKERRERGEGDKERIKQFDITTQRE